MAEPEHEAESQRVAAHLSMFQLKNTLHRVLVELQQVRHRAVAQRGILLDRLLDR
jgi:hypothetical protein